MKSNDFFTLANGVKIPAIGFGTWQIPSGDIAYNSVREALKAGYRHIDTAQAYGNEASVGKAILDSGIDRSEIFVTSKLPAEIKSYDKAVRRTAFTMKQIGLDYIDLYLIHAPWPWTEIGADYTKENIEVWKAMEEFYESGKTRSIGISNFNVKDINAILDNSRIRPMVNQIKLHIGYPQKEIVNHCVKNEILVEGYSPLATGRILKNKEIAKLQKDTAKALPSSQSVTCFRKERFPFPNQLIPSTSARTLTWTLGLLQRT